MGAGARVMSIRQIKSQVQDNGELEQALTTAEDARDEAAQFADELDTARLLLAQREQEIQWLRTEMGRRDADAEARLREMEDSLLDGQAKDALLAEELQVAIEELSVSNQELHRVNNDLELRVAERTARIMESERRLSLALSQAGADIWSWEISTDLITWTGRKGAGGKGKSGDGGQKAMLISRSAWIQHIHSE